MCIEGPLSDPASSSGRILKIFWGPFPPLFDSPRLPSFRFFEGYPFGRYSPPFLHTVSTLPNATSLFQTYPSFMGAPSPQWRRDFFGYSWVIVILEPLLLPYGSKLLTFCLTHLPFRHHNTWSVARCAHPTDFSVTFRMQANPGVSTSRAPPTTVLPLARPIFDSQTPPLFTPIAGCTSAYHGSAASLPAC